MRRFRPDSYAQPFPRPSVYWLRVAVPTATSYVTVELSLIRIRSPARWGVQASSTTPCLPRAFYSNPPSLWRKPSHFSALSSCPLHPT